MERSRGLVPLSSSAGSGSGGGAQHLAPVAGTVAFDVADGETIFVELPSGDTVTIAAPANPVDGQRFRLVIYNNSGDPATITYGGGVFWTAEYTASPDFVVPSYNVSAREFVFFATDGSWFEVSGTPTYVESPAAVVAFGEEGNPDPHYSFYTGIADVLYAASTNPMVWGIGVFTFREGQRVTLLLDNQSDTAWTVHIASTGFTGVDDVAVPAGEIVRCELVALGAALRLLEAVSTLP